MSAPPSFTKEDFALWNQTTSVFHLPKRLVGKSKVPQLRAELVKTIGEKRVSAVQALPDFNFRVCFSSPSVRCAFDINGLNFRGLTITHFPAYEEVKAVFVLRSFCSPLQMPDQFLFDALAPYGRVILVKHLTICGFQAVKIRHSYGVDDRIKGYSCRDSRCWIFIVVSLPWTASYLFCVPGGGAHGKGLSKVAETSGP